MINPDPNYLGTWGHRTEFHISTGDVLYAPLEWYRGAQERHAVARSQITSPNGEPLEYWIELQRRGCDLLADPELLRKPQRHRDAGEAIAAANRIERIHRAQHRLQSQDTTQAAGEPGRGAP